MRFVESNIHVVRAGNTVLQDILRPEDNEHVADFIVDRVRELTSDDSVRVHASIAGGRKTMGFYLGYAMSLFGRTQDELSHVLVDPGYEGHPGFFYPTRDSRIIHNDRTGEPLDTSRDRVRVNLASIPFVRLRAELPPASLVASQRFHEVVDRLQRREQTPELVIDYRAGKITANGVDVALRPVFFAFYAWMVRRAAGGLGSVSAPRDFETNVDYADGMLREYEAMAGELGVNARVIDALRRGMDKGYFDEKKSQINRVLRESLGKQMGGRFSIASFGTKGHTRYGVDLPPAAISFK